MTALEHYVGMMKGEPVDFVPRTPILMQFAAAYETVGNPFIVNAGCKIPSGTPEENLKALCEPVACRP
jgi:uroporphyrinogen-III decarboxylase